MKKLTLFLAAALLAASFAACGNSGASSSTAPEPTAIPDDILNAPATKPDPDMEIDPGFGVDPEDSSAALQPEPDAELSGIVDQIYAAHPVDLMMVETTAVDLTAGKNLAGAFCQPAAVICDTDCLKTLPPDVFADGAAEAVKTGVLSDEALFALFEDGTLTADPGEVIARCVAYKAGVVERDEKEQGERKLLNLGHTVGHAIEKCSGYVIPHGHAVAAGLAVIARAAEALGWTEESLAARITACLSKNGLPTGTDYSAEALAEAALSDKKRAGGDITLVVPRKIGHCELRKVPVADLLPIIRAGLEA